MNGLSLVRAAYGAVVLARPDRVLRLYSGRPAHPPDTAVLRVLGARHLLQAAATARPAGATALLTGAAVDTAHALSMTALGLTDRPRRRAALIDAAVAGSFATAGVLLAIRKNGERDAKSAG